jgi:predicted secreted hydrolase
LLALAAVACGEPRQEVQLAPLSAVQPPPSTYQPIQFPRDEAPHDVLTEWWYYTGHLEAADGRRYGFELVIFQTIRGEYPVVYLGQFAVTDRQRQQFQHAHRLGQGSQLGRQDGFDLSIDDWRMRGALGRDALEASMDDYAISLELQALKPPALHDHDGLVSFDVAGDSYYYSYTRMAVSGTLVDHGQPLAVHGQAWFDHQWGNFLVMGGGWDWFSIQFDDGSDLMLNHLRDDEDRLVGVWGTYVDPLGGYRPLGAADFQIQPTGSWTSPKTGGTYPMGWNVTHADPSYELRLVPALLDQELVSEGSAPSYWEGAVDVVGTRAGRPVSGLGYVELTGYAKRLRQP